MNSPVYTVDVAHPPRRPDDVEHALLDAWETVRNSSTLRILKIIHGYGSRGKGGSTRELVRNWAFQRRERFRAVVDGENCGLQNPAIVEIRQETGEYGDADLTMPNPGITIIWIR